MLKINHEAGLVGDAIAGYPALFKLAQYQPLHVAVGNKLVSDLFPNENIMYKTDGLFEDPHYYLNGSEHFDQCFDRHMWNVHYTDLGLSAQNELEYVPVFTLPAPPIEFDILVSPFSRSDHNHNKLWFNDRWSAIFDKFSGYKFLMVGGPHDKEFFDDASFVYQNDNVEQAFNLPLTQVADLIKRSKFVLSIDNGISHLTHMLGKDHILLYPDCLPKIWVGNFRLNCRTIHDKPENITVTQVSDLIHHLLLFGAVI